MEIYQLGEIITKSAIWLLLFISTLAYSTPSRIILLRHGEKKNDYALCSIGQERSIALREQYLGKGATQSLFPTAPPSAIFATTLHTLELASPTASSWDLPVITYAALPLPHETASESTEQVTRQTELAAKDIMQSSQWNGKTIVMIWEHKHIANKKLSRDDSDHFVELRQLLKFDRIPENIKTKIPKTWSGANYNFFWIVDYDDKGNPMGFQEVRQNFTGKFANLPNNNWGEPEKLPANSDCKKWKGK